MVDNKLIWIFGILGLLALVLFLNPVDSYLYQDSLCGCVDNTDNITCNGTIRCHTIDTDKDVYILSAIMFGNYSADGACANVDSNITINSSGNVYIINSSLLGQGLTGTTNNGDCDGKVVIKSANLYVHNSSIFGYGGMGGASGAGEAGRAGAKGFCLFNATSMIFYHSTISCYGGDASDANAQDGKNGELGNLTMFYSTIYAYNTSFNSFGGDGSSGAAGQSSGSGANGYLNLNGTMATFVNSVFRFYAGAGKDGTPDGAFGTGVGYIKSNIYSNGTILNGSFHGGSSAEVVQKSNFTLIANDVVYFKSSKLFLFTDNTNKSIINITGGNHSVWNQRPKLILNSTSSIPDNVFVYFYQNASIFNMTQWSPHNLTIKGNYKNITVETNLEYNYPYNVIIDCFNDSVVDWTNNQTPLYSKELNDAKLVTCINQSKINTYLETCVPNAAGNCTIAIAITSNNPSMVNFTNITIRYFNAGVSNKTLVAYNVTSNTTQWKYLWFWVNMTNSSMGLRYNLNLSAEKFGLR